MSMIHDADRREVIELLKPALAAFGGVTTTSLEEACRKTRSFGMSVVRGTVNFGVTGVGKAFRDTLGQPVGALSVAAMAERMTTARIAKIASELEVACRQVELGMRNLRRCAWHAGR